MTDKSAFVLPFDGFKDVVTIEISEEDIGKIIQTYIDSAIGGFGNVIGVGPPYNDGDNSQEGYRIDIKPIRRRTSNETKKRKQ